MKKEANKPLFYLTMLFYQIIIKIIKPIIRNTVPNVMQDNFFAVFTVSSSSDLIASIRYDGNKKAQITAIITKTMPTKSHPYFIS